MPGLRQRDAGVRADVAGAAGDEDHGAEFRGMSAEVACNYPLSRQWREEWISRKPGGDLASSREPRR